MARTKITDKLLADHVERLEQDHPPIPLESVDFTVKDADAVRGRFGTMFDYLARVELEVERNVKELEAILPNAPEVDIYFYRDVWYHQELRHGHILDHLKAELDLPPAEPLNEVATPVKLLGAAARVRPIQDVARCLYYFTGASTERQAVLAYSALIDRLDDAGEDAISQTLVQPIKRQEPGHFAYYRMSAELLGTKLRPWQRWLVQQLRTASYAMVGTNGDEEYKRDIGGLMVTFDLDRDLEAYAREVGRLEARIVWANRNGMEFPPYVLESMRESVELYREKGLSTLPARYDLEGHALVEQPAPRSLVGVR